MGLDADDANIEWVERIFSLRVWCVRWAGRDFVGIFSIFHNMRFVMGLMEVNDFLGWSDGCDLMVLFAFFYNILL